MRDGWPLLALGLAGCSLVFPLENRVVEVDVDAAVDADPALCYTSRMATLCLELMPTEPLVVTAGQTMQIETDTACQVYTGGEPGAWCVVAARSVLISGTLRAHGSRPLVVVVAGDFAVDGLVDVSSSTSQNFTGAGANPADCIPSLAPAMAGGHGGSFVGTGGGGGRATGNQQEPAAADHLRGGCRGAGGGLGGGFAGGPGGIGGGAVAVIARGAITIVGTVNASGGGGHGAASTNSGGGGGGAGGLVSLAGQSLTVGATGKVFANGGGGGEGAGNPANGFNGQDPITPELAATGADGGSMNGGRGGDGTALVIIDGQSGGVQGTGGGGGGGGGAAGAIMFEPPGTLEGVVSPLPN